MPCHADEDDWNEDDWDDPEEDEPPDEDDESETVPCPYCGKLIHEDSERCPNCEHYISLEDAPPNRKPVWFVIGAVAALAVVYMWIVR